MQKCQCFCTPSPQSEVCWPSEQCTTSERCPGACNERRDFVLSCAAKLLHRAARYDNFTQFWTEQGTAVRSAVAIGCGRSRFRFWCCRPCVLHSWRIDAPSQRGHGRACHRAPAKHPRGVCGRLCFAPHHLGRGALDPERRHPRQGICLARADALQVPGPLRVGCCRGCARWVVLLLVVLCQVAISSCAG